MKKFGSRFLIWTTIILIYFSICSCTVDVESPQYNLCTVTFDTNGGSHVSSQILLSGTTATEPKDPNQYARSFLGWYTDHEFKNKFNFETPITRSVTLYAKWSYQVVFMDAEGNILATLGVDETENKVAKPNDPTIKDGEFLGWYTDSNFSNEFNFETAITGDVTLYAKWLAKVCFVDENENVIHTYWVESGNEIPFSGHISSLYQVYTDKECTQLFDFKCKILSPIALYVIGSEKFQSLVCGKLKKIGGGFVQYDIRNNFTGLKGLTVNDFFICDHEVTQTEFSAVMGRNPSTYIGADRPVDSVSWYDAIEYCNKLSQMEGFTPCYTINKNTIPNQLDDLNWDVTCDFSADGYRLPTQTEWLYAARDGRNFWTDENGASHSNRVENGIILANICSTAIYSGIDGGENAYRNVSDGVYGYTNSYVFRDGVGSYTLSFPDSETALDYVAWYEGNSGGETHDVMTKAPNRNSLYDMTGNVREWCWDEWDKVKERGFNGRRALGGSYESVTSSTSRYSDFCRLLNTENEFMSESVNNNFAISVCEDIGFRVVRSCSE